MNEAETLADEIRTYLLEHPRLKYWWDLPNGPVMGRDVEDGIVAIIQRGLKAGRLEEREWCAETIIREAQHYDDFTRVKMQVIARAIRNQELTP